MLKDNEMSRGVLHKPDAVVAIAVGTFVAVALNVWYNVAGSRGTISAQWWLARVHAPAASLAERFFYTLYPRIGNPWSLRCAVACGYIVLLVMWILAAFAVVKMTRLIGGSDPKFRKPLLFSLVICGIGYLGLALTDVPVYAPVGMAWSVAVLASWVITTAITFRRCGRKALWLLLEAPVVLLPFYGLFLVDL
jgi:hypothetical protein